MQLAFSVNGTTWTYINELTDVDAPPLVIGRIPASTLLTPNKVMRKKPGWIDPGEATFKVALTASQLTVLCQNFFSRASLFWQEYYPSDFGGTVVGGLKFFGWIGNLQPGQGMTRDQNEIIIVNLTVVLESVDPATFFSATTVPALAAEAADAGKAS